MTPSMSDVRLPITFFANSFETRPRPSKPLVDELVQVLTTFSLHPALKQKHLLPAWSPATFSGARRASVAVRFLSCLVFDLDEAGSPPIQPPWAENLWVVHSTWSHRAAAPRLRLVVPLARPVQAALWAHAWDWVAAFVPGLDRKCKDPGRMYYLPAVPSLDCPRHHEVHPGELFDLLAVLPPPPPPRTNRPRRRVKVPARCVTELAIERYRTDPGTRQRAAVMLGAKIAGTGDGVRAEDIACPGCGRPSAWFWLSPTQQTRVYCQHRESCGWTGELILLVADAGR